MMTICWLSDYCYLHPDDYKIKYIENDKVKGYTIETNTLKATRARCYNGTYIVYFENCSDLLWETYVPVIKNNFCVFEAYIFEKKLRLWAPSFFK